MASIHTHLENFEVEVLGGPDADHDEVTVAIEFTFVAGQKPT